MQLTIDGVPVAVASDGSFGTAVPLQEGANEIVVVATDLAGNASQVVLHVRANATPPALSIAAPADGLTTSAGSVTVTGSALPGDPTDTVPVSVTVNGVAASVAADGSFSADVPLASGANPIHIVALDGYGLQTTADITVVGT